MYTFVLVPCPTQEQNMLDNDYSNERDFSDRYVRPGKNKNHSRGLSPLQRFIVTLVILLMVAAVGLFILIVFQKIVLPR